MILIWNLFMIIIKKLQMKTIKYILKLIKIRLINQLKKNDKMSKGLNITIEQLIQNTK